ncbi:glycerate kinase [Schaalia sp. ZJ405]|uniref:glycerate kinase n=1 Tax=Schaalia sp. ZJ405 TaxID=2709403 RepID=UPI0013EB9814|nr:glycerate kinase [Schaalia sp. ZJ405]QPK81751.1 glycerate kinase [Schaalia sp. ZJ405]
MKIVIAPDSFKETMSAATVAHTMSQAVRSVWPHADCVEVPVADGGEGTTDSLIDALGGTREYVDTVDALGRPRTATYGWIPDQRLAVLEVAQAVGIEHIAPNERRPRQSGTAGVGLMLTQILTRQPRHLIIGLGGSATNDGGWGMCHALGVRAYTGDNTPIDPYAPLDLTHATRIDTSHIDPAWADVTITLACDVTNPLTGPTGATAVFGPQKGVQPKDIDAFDEALTQWGSLLDANDIAPVTTLPGAGAAGGLGAAFMGCLGATASPGVDTVLDAVNLDAHLSDADLVLTGEGSIDSQTRFGKTPWGVMQRARAHGIPTIAFAGNVAHDLDDLCDNGFTAIVPTVREVCDLPTALATARESLYESVAMMCQILNAASNVAGSGAVDSAEKPTGDVTLKGGRSC